LGDVQERKGVAVTIQHKLYRAVVILIRPVEGGGKFQLCFIFGNKKWRRRPSMHITLVRITFRGHRNLLAASRNLPDFSCTCSAFRTCDNCAHKEATIGNIRNKMKILTLDGNHCASQDYPVTTFSSSRYIGARPFHRISIRPLRSYWICVNLGCERHIETCCYALHVPGWPKI